MPAAPRVGAPVFVGGTGRSGTTVLGQLIGARRDVALVPVELRFHVDPGGLSDLAAGTVTVDEFDERMRKSWFARPARNGPRGLHVIATRGRMRRELRRLHEEYTEDPWRASGRFMRGVVRPFCLEAGKESWVEMTPGNAHRADALCRMFPRGRIVHAVRDGRDVAASVARLHWGPNDVTSALEWWADELIEIRAATERADAARVHTIRLEALVGPGREREYDALVDFLGRGPDDRMRAFFDREMTVDRSHPGTWRNALDIDEQQRIDALYELQLDRLADAGVAIPPLH